MIHCTQKLYSGSDFIFINDVRSLFMINYAYPANVCIVY